MGSLPFIEIVLRLRVALNALTIGQRYGGFHGITRKLQRNPQGPVDVT